VVDLLIVGGGPAGLATAIRARQAGLAATVLDRSRPPVDKACGEGLMPDGLARLEELGVTLSPGEAAPFRGIRYLDEHTVADGDFPRPRSGQVVGLGVRRTVLHRALVARAEAVGVDLRWGERATGLTTGGSEPDAETVAVTTADGVHRGRFLVGADGLRSRVRRWAGLDPGDEAGRPGRSGRKRRPGRFGVRRHFRLAPWSDRVEVYWTDGAEAYVTPVAPNLVGVAVLWSGETSGFDDLLTRFPALAARLSGAPAASDDRGCGPLSQRPRAVVRGRIALVGDASGYLDAITGEGLSLAFHHAFALVDAVAAGDLGRYARAHRRLGRLPEALIRLLLAVERRPALRRRTLRALAADPELFSRLLAVHARSAPVSEVGVVGALTLVGRLTGRLAWRLASA
jgi:flavin-dependent dehydrogenase